MSTCNHQTLPGSTIAVVTPETVLDEANEPGKGAERNSSQATIHSTAVPTVLVRLGS